MATHGLTTSLDCHTEVAHHLHLQQLLAAGHRHLVLRELRRAAPHAALPDRASVLRTVQGHQQRHVLAEVDDTLVLLETWRDDARVWVSSDDEAAAVAVADEVRARVPRLAEERRVPVLFSDYLEQSRSSVLDVRPWSEVSGHYGPEVGRAMDELVQHVPTEDLARRLVLWHGPPGTGKTTALRALLHAWREWCEPVVVTDPGTLLSDGRYLRQLVLDVDDDERWRLFVLEDAEALLHKQTGGPAMGRLLNLADGLLGQGLRCLFLITTNEPVGVLHPALVRPGRCLAQVEFGPLAPEQASSLLGRRVHRPMTLAEVMTAAPLEAVAAPAAVGQYL